MKHEAVVNAGKVVGSYRSNSNDEVSKGTNVHTVVFATSVSLLEPDTDTDVMSRMAAVAAVEPDADGLDLHTTGLVSASIVESEYWKTQLEDADILPTGCGGAWGPSPSRSSSPSPSRSFAGTKWVAKPGGPQRRPLHPLRPPPASNPPVGAGSGLATSTARSSAAISPSKLDSPSRTLSSTGNQLEIGHQLVTSSAPERTAPLWPPPPPEKEVTEVEETPPPPVRRSREVDFQSTAPEETAEEMEARVRRKIEIEIRKEMEEAAARKEEVAKENAEARKAQKVVRDLAELASREAKATAEAVKDAAAQRARDAAEAVALEALETRVRDVLREAEAAEVLAAALREAAGVALAAAAQRTAVMEAEEEVAEEEAAEEAEQRTVAALAEKADGLLKAGHAANNQGDYAKARPRHPASPCATLPRCLCATSPQQPPPRGPLPPPPSALSTVRRRPPQPRSKTRRAGAPLLPGGARATAQARGADLGGQHGAQATRGLHCQAGVRAGHTRTPAPLLSALPPTLLALTSP